MSCALVEFLYFVCPCYNVPSLPRARQNFRDNGTTLSRHNQSRTASLLCDNTSICHTSNFVCVCIAHLLSITIARARYVLGVYDFSARCAAAFRGKEFAENAVRKLFGSVMYRSIGRWNSTKKTIFTPLCQHSQPR